MAQDSGADLSRRVFISGGQSEGLAWRSPAGPARIDRCAHTIRITGGANFDKSSARSTMPRVCEAYPLVISVR